jgi:hypothetical protein
VPLLGQVQRRTAKGIGRIIDRIEKIVTLGKVGRWPAAVSQRDATLYLPYLHRRLSAGKKQMIRQALTTFSALLLLVVGLAGCGSRPAGQIDSRLVGVWESRRGFTGTDTLDFKNDGTVQVTAFDGKKKKSYVGQWFVAEQGKEQIKVSMQAQGKEAFRTRRVKFHDDGSFELREGGTLLGRFEKKG